MSAEHRGLAESRDMAGSVPGKRDDGRRSNCLVDAMKARAGCPDGRVPPPRETRNQRGGTQGAARRRPPGVTIPLSSPSVEARQATPHGGCSPPD